LTLRRWLRIVPACDSPVFPAAFPRPVNPRLVLMASEMLAVPVEAVVLNSPWSSLDA
jgi:hypothetical protein